MVYEADSRVGQSTNCEVFCEVRGKKTSAKAAIVEDRRRAKSPDVLAHRLSHLHNSHQGVGSGFGKHLFFPLALICLSQKRKLPVSRYMDMVSEFDATLSCWVAEGCHFIVAVAGLSFYYKTLPLHVKKRI